MGTDLWGTGINATEDSDAERQPHLEEGHLDTSGCPSCASMSLPSAETSGRQETIPGHPKEYVLVLGPLGDPPRPKPSKETLSSTDMG